MIWIATQDGSQDISCYFEIRAIDLQPCAAGSQGTIRGLLGDGQAEVWAEVQLGAKPQVQILPVWSDEGQVETLAAELDEEQLKQQLLIAVQKLFSRFAALTAMSEPVSSAGAETVTTFTRGSHLAA